MGSLLSNNFISYHKWIHDAAESLLKATVVQADEQDGNMHAMKPGFS